MPTLRVAFLGAVAGMCFTTAVFAQMPAYTKAGPIPPALSAAKTVFVSNASSNSYLLLKDPWYKGGADRPYTEFYAALKATGDFTMAVDPAQADLVLELHFDDYGIVHNEPMFRLIIYDVKTHYILWTVTRAVDYAGREENRERNFDTALSDVLNQFLQITGKTPAPAH